MKYRNYNNNSNYRWIFFILFLFLGGFRLITILLPLLIALLIQILPLIFFIYIITRFVKGINLNNNLNSYKKSDSIDHSRFVELLIHILIKVVKADGHIDNREIQVIRNFFSQKMHYRRIQMIWVNDLIKYALSNSFPLEDLCSEFNNKFNYESRLILLDLVYQVVLSDNHLSNSEKVIIDRIIDLLKISENDHNQIKSLFFDPSREDHHYSVLGLKKGASKDEIRKAYKDACKKHHPDKVFHLGEEFKQVAEEKMSSINASYEYLIKRI